MLSTPYFLDKKYMQNLGGTQNCSGSFDIEEVPNLKACKKTSGYSLGASLYGFRYFGGEVDSANNPKGCYADGNHNIYWNKHPTGGTSPWSKPVCQRGKHKNQRYWITLFDQIKLYYENGSYFWYTCDYLLYPFYPYIVKQLDANAKIL